MQDLNLEPYFFPVPLPLPLPVPCDFDFRTTLLLETGPGFYFPRFLVRE